ncbi:MAG: hypothetical protein LBV38_02585 [Alistipes sp.]|jgi:cytochrome c551/c552|nr:hypothetical protein [Alistipes sp.]
MNSIDRLIYDALAMRRSVLLEGVGTLEVRRRGAKRISDTQIIPPQNVVLFSPDEDEGAVDVTLLVADANGVTESEATAIYQSWLEEHRTDAGVAIDGVGEVRDGRFVVAESMHITLNPTNEEIVTMETERNSAPTWAWLVIGILAAVLLLGLAWNWKNGSFMGRGSETVEIATAVAEATVAAQAAFAAEAEIAAASASSAASTETEAVEAAGPRYHVIAGAFSVESNADNFMARIKREHPELTVEKLTNPSNGYSMVSIFQSPEEGVAVNRMNLYWDIDLFLWVYRER